MIDVELTDPTHLTAGYTGQPGSRTFFVQAADEHTQVTLQAEKGQVAGIAELLGQLLSRLDDVPATDWDRDAMALRRPIEARWQIGAIQVGLDPEGGRFLLELSEFVVEDEVTGQAPEPREVRIWADQDQARRFAAHGEEVIGQGRPRCELCGRPTDLDGSHVCPSTNGHGRLHR